MPRASLAAMAAASIALAACGPIPRIQLAADEVPMVTGSRARLNTTIMTDAFRCFDQKLAEAGKPRMNIAVGNIADYSGKATDAEGAVITKGGSLMLFSALGLMRQSVRLHDRFDTSVTDLEMGYINARQLGDGRKHEVDGETVPWLPYYGGSIAKSDYVILGGITEVNFNIASGGWGAEVNQIGGKARSFTMSVAADLRLVETQSLVVRATASFQKQFTGYEVGANLFSFFDVFEDKQLFDIYAGNIQQEPMQLGVRAILEEATLKVLSDLTQVDYRVCTVPQPVAAAGGEDATPASPSAEAAPVKREARAAPATAVSGPQREANQATLVVGAFSVEANARDGAARLASRGYAPTVTATDRDGKRWWVVTLRAPRSGEVLSQVRAAGFADAYFL